ncbi:ABC transporter family substrate-binding protein [Nocardia concava]|uniref:ABC transporter family substrate-binding protein n=1 Tax=Nocardia concava TaxID=257281 RepID=UPI00030BE218|nr:ABC transporter family substrate-binding protein [Nocardia concava]
MRIRSIGLRLAVPLVAVAMVTTGCGGDNDNSNAVSSDLGTTSDINPHDVADLKDGGNLRLAVSALPSNWNTLQIDGNDAEITSIERSTMPRAFISDAAGNLSVDHNYFTDVQLTSTDPQQVTYTINPKAVWSDGTPITWEDIASAAEALSGRNKDFLIANNNGFDRVAKVERGVDDRQAILTFSKHLGEWRGQFSGNSFLVPKAVTSTPEAFNKGFVDNPGPSAGPFMVQSIDRGQGRIVLGRNPKWWGNTPKLDTITFSVLDSSADLPALQNNEIDVVGLGSRDEIKTAQGTNGIAIRRANSMQWSHLTFNGAPGSILADPKLRVAIGKAIDRQGIATAMQNGMVIDPKPLNNHIYLKNQKGYQDNSLGFDPDAAAKELDELGWKVPAGGGTREKDGRKLEIRDVMYNQDLWVQIAQIMQQNLDRVGVKLIIDTKPGQDFFPRYIKSGDFDVTQFSWVGDLFPLSSMDQIWGYHPDDWQGNYGHIGYPELNDLIEKGVSELDPAKAIEIANQVDKKVFEEGHSLPLMQTPANVGVRANLANYGAAGLQSLDYTKIGFLK